MTIPPQCSPRLDTSSHPNSLTLCSPWPPKAANTLRRPLLRGLRGVGLGVLHRCGCGVTSRIWLISRRPLLAVAGVLTAWAPANTTRAFPESDCLGKRDERCLSVGSGSHDVASYSSILFRPWRLKNKTTPESKRAKLGVSRTLSCPSGLRELGSWGSRGNGHGIWPDRSQLQPESPAAKQP